MSDKDWCWFTALNMILLSCVSPVQAVTWIALGLALMSLTLSFFSSDSFAIQLTIILREGEEKNHSPFGKHTSEDK